MRAHPAARVASRPTAAPSRSPGGRRGGALGAPRGVGLPLGCRRRWAAGRGLGCRTTGAPGSAGRAGRSARGGRPWSRGSLRARGGTACRTTRGASPCADEGWRRGGGPRGVTGYLVSGCGLCRHGPASPACGRRLLVGLGLAVVPGVAGLAAGVVVRGARRRPVAASTLVTVVTSEPSVFVSLGRRRHVALGAGGGLRPRVRRRQRPDAASERDHA